MSKTLDLYSAEITLSHQAGMNEGDFKLWRKRLPRQVKARVTRELRRGQVVKVHLTGPLGAPNRLLPQALKAGFSAGAYTLVK